MSGMNAVLGMPGATIEADDDFDAINQLYLDRGWSDGLPIVPPTAPRVEAMLAYCDRPWNEPVGNIGPRYGEATPVRIAVNAVMAGARPQYFPLIVLALEAMCEKRFNLYGVQATTHDVAPLMIFNGPVAREVGLNGGHNAFGPGVHSNATIGRAVRLALVNIGGAIPTIGDMCTFGSPAKYTYCAAENEAANPWEPLHVDRGFDLNISTVTVVGAECPHNINDHESTTAVGVLTTIAGSMGIAGVNDVYHDVAEPVVLIGPEHAKTIADGGYSKAEVKRFLFNNANLPLSKFSAENIERRLKFWFKGKYDNAAPDTLVPMIQRPEDLIVAVIGGAGKHSAYIPSFGATLSVTRALHCADGRLARSVEDFRRG
jgi:hypothetical protein